MPPDFHSSGAAAILNDWPLPAGDTLRGVVILVHGLGEHIGRYHRVADRLNQWGFAVRGYDQYGHGHAPGRRGVLPQPNRLLSDLAGVIDDTRAQFEDHVPVILLGHSMGGLVAARLVSLRLRPVDALVLSSPALDAGMHWWQKKLAQWLTRVAPGVRLGNGLNATYLSHDLAVVKAYRADPLVHDRISARLADFIARAGPATLAEAPRWAVPTLLLFAGQDRLVNPRGSWAFAQAAPPGCVQMQAFPMLYHELFNELEHDEVFEVLGQWLRARFAPVALLAAA